MKPPPSPALAALALALAACGSGPHATAAPVPAAAATPSTTAPPASDHAGDAPAAAASPMTAPPLTGCNFTPAPGAAGPVGISVLGLGDGGGGFDMPEICPQQACNAGLTLDLPRSDAWPAGMYDVEITTDGGRLRCHVAMTAPGRWTAPASCAHQRELRADCVGPEAPSLGPIMISGAPAAVRVAIEIDGAAVADQTIHPSYSSTRWDGWDCDPSCASAKGAITVR